MKIVIPGGSGRIGQVLARYFHGRGDQVTVLSRTPRSAPWKVVSWDGRGPGEWIKEIDGADVVINLAGRSVDCRYTPENRKEIMDSRVNSTRAIGNAIAEAVHPPVLWLNASTATIYRHSLDRAMDEATGEIGGREHGEPAMWRFSIDVATAWERTFFEASTPHTRKVAMRSAIVTIASRDGWFGKLMNLVRFGLGGPAGPGTQYMSWIHESDFIRAIEFLMARPDLDGCVNLASPNPLPNRDFMRALRKAYGMPFGPPLAVWMLRIGTVLLRTEAELVLKSRRVVPRRLLEAGFEFVCPLWEGAAEDLVRRWRALPEGQT